MNTPTNNADAENVRLAKVERRLLVPAALSLGYETDDKIHVILLRDYPGVVIPSNSQMWGVIGVAGVGEDKRQVDLPLVCLNVAPRAVTAFSLNIDESGEENSDMSFTARFAGVPQNVIIPLSAIMQISYPGRPFLDVTFSPVPSVHLAYEGLEAVGKVVQAEKPSKAPFLRVVK